RGRVQEGRRSAAHCLATGWKPAAKIYVVKPLGLVSFGTRIRLLAGVAVALDRQGESAGNCRMRAAREALPWRKPQQLLSCDACLGYVAAPIGGLSEGRSKMIPVSPCIPSPCYPKQAKFPYMCGKSHMRAARR